ncbi:fumarylacetoacetate hydrolase [Limnohabitans sp. Jir61]|uniref:fumarylacetoacetate hydrolase family protein n=1 Tax=Limnohabitans sp. Jir61 TaxID=1826168 RepID=UPI000D387880|nr:fumarylacetoacetate hydrolase family protein [Limnohabitans sp. Jir61]PUE31262.1 fumarylacetoacetate hydrolase [Limnohabitans sp. Jir61]
MKLATYKDGTRDGQLVVVSRDLSTAHYATGIATRMQQALDDWGFIAPQLQDLYETLNNGKARHAFPFDPAMCMAPLPRAFQWVDGSAYLSHVTTVRSALDIDLPNDTLETDPLMSQGSGDCFVGAQADIHCTNDAMGLDFEAELAVITGDVPMGASVDDALEAVRLVVLVNDVSLRMVAKNELPKGLGYVQSKPATAFGPVAVTLDELGDAWDNGRVRLTVQSTVNGRKVGMCDAGADMAFHFGQLIAHVSKTRPVRAGAVVGSGAVSNAPIENNGKQEWPKGVSCLIEKRAIEMLLDGKTSTEYLKPSDSVRIEVKGKDGQSVFGAIDQTVVGPDV